MMVDKNQLLKEQAKSEENFILAKRSLALKQEKLNSKQQEANRIFEELNNRHIYVARQIGDNQMVDSHDFMNSLAQVSHDFKQHIRQENDKYEAEFAKQKSEYQHQEELTRQAIKNLEG